MGTTQTRPTSSKRDRLKAFFTHPLRSSLGSLLAFAFVTIAAVLLMGTRLAQQATSETASLVSSVGSRYQPTLQRSRELEDVVEALNRNVAGLSTAPAENDLTVIGLAATQMMTVFENNVHGIPDISEATIARLREQLLGFQRDGLGLCDLYRQRNAAVLESSEALKALAVRATRAGSGVGSGDQVLARRSLADLAQMVVKLRTDMLELFATAAPVSPHSVSQDASVVASLLRLHTDEFSQSPGRAWLDLMQDDLAGAVSGERHFLRIAQQIEAERGRLSVSASQLERMIDVDVQRPSLNGLTREAERARLAAEEAESVLARVTLIIIGLVVAIGAATVYGIVHPARRLLEGTRRLAAGALDARVPRGGVRELDELAEGFNDLATALDATQAALREQQAALEERVTERTEQLRHLANHDALTGLPNRRELEARITTAIARTRAGTARFAVFYLDIDNFKNINDSLGHQFGDRVLRGIGARLVEAASAAGVLARLGGDEFTLLVDDIGSVAAAEAYAQQIMQAFQRPVSVDDRDLLVSLSIGIALCPQHGDTADALLRAADSALFQAKDSGRNAFSVYRTELLAAASHRFHTEQGLRRAVEGGDLLLHLQPEVSLLDMRTSVAEALLRWRQPNGRIVAAAEFMAVAEQSGLILELSAWLLREALNAARQLRNGCWPQARVAINVSSQQFLTGRFVDTVTRALSDAGMPADCLEIELTESALQNGRLVVDALHELRCIGVAVALDDFGAGYSSLRSIDELPLTRVKLDRSLTQDIESTASAAAIATSVIRLCQDLGLTVTAEGIERPEQLEFLMHCGDVHVQGYLIAKPAPLEDIARFIAATPTDFASIWPDQRLVHTGSVLTHEAAVVPISRSRRR